jgi:hypothetical protein
VIALVQANALPVRHPCCLTWGARCGRPVSRPAGASPSSPTMW